MCVLSSDRELRCAPSLSDIDCERAPAGALVCMSGGPNAATVPLEDVASFAMGLSQGVFPNSATNCAVRRDGTVWCFSGTGPAEAVVQETVFGSDAIAVEANRERGVCAIKTDGSLWCRNDAYHGQDDVQLALPGPAVGISSGALRCATLADGSAWCWGFVVDSNLHGHG